VHPGAEARQQLARAPDPGREAIRVCGAIDPELLVDIAHWFRDEGPVAGPVGTREQELLLQWSRMLRGLP